MMDSPTRKRRCVFWTIGNLCFSLFGCGAFTEPSTLTMQLEPLSLSADLDAQIVATDLERAFLRTFHHPPVLIDVKQADMELNDTVPFSSPADRRQLRLEGLDTAEKTVVSCPGGLAQMSYTDATVPDQPWLDVFTACVQATTNRQRIILGVGTVGAASMIAQAGPSYREARLNKLNQLRQAFLTLHASSAQPLHVHGTHATKKLSHPALHAAQSNPVNAVPLLCLAPKMDDDIVPVFALPQEGAVIGTVQTGRVVVGRESDSPFFFRVTMEEGISGWVNRTQMRRSPCPIG